MESIGQIISLRCPEHSSGGEKSDFESLEEEEIHLEGIIAGYYCIENLYFDRELRQDVEVCQSLAA